MRRDVLLYAFSDNIKPFPFATSIVMNRFAIAAS